MTRRLMKRMGWRAPTGPELVAELDRCVAEADAAFGRPLGVLTPGELLALAADIRVRADSAAELLQILAQARGKR